MQALKYEMIICVYSIILTTLLSLFNTLTYDEILREKARSEIQKKKNQYWGQRFSHKKRIIVFLGDGMGPSSISLGRIWKKEKLSDPEASLSWESFEHVGIVKTQNFNQYISESSSCATALFCGTKTKSFIVGLNSSANLNDCSSEEKAAVKCIGEDALSSNLSVGFVTSTAVTDDTIASWYAHSSFHRRDSDRDLPKDSKCKDIAYQLIKDYPGNRFKVILGGGLKNFRPPSSGGNRISEEDLVESWKKNKIHSNESFAFVKSFQELEETNAAGIDSLLGLLADYHLEFEINRKTKEYQLLIMVKKALEVLEKDPNGYVLLVEGARIDHAHHYNLAFEAANEILALDFCVDYVKKHTKGALVLVTADHSHSLSLSGVLPMDNSIFNFNRDKDHSIYFNKMDGLTFMPLLYTTGPGYFKTIRRVKNRFQRKQLSIERVQNVEKKIREGRFIYPTQLPVRKAFHGGEDVFSYADGPFSFLFSGALNQYYIYHALKFAINA